MGLSKRWGGVFLGLRTGCSLVEPETMNSEVHLAGFGLRCIVVESSVMLSISRWCVPLLKVIR